MSGGNYYTENSGETAIDLTGANGWIFRPVTPVEIIRWGIVLTVAGTVAAFELSGNHRQAGGAALTPSGTGDVGTVTSETTTDIGLGYFTEVVSPNDSDTTTQPFMVLPGEEVQFVSDGNPTAGEGVIWVTYRRMNFQDDNVDANMRTAALTAPIADSTWLANLTEVDS